ncbi:MAG TPA: sulfite exporter TauE/SafE family protein [Actinomycetota bacterium]|nr:sulfite exporter TauE/SafE family protein [Actinomycetota bacterium]
MDLTALDLLLVGLAALAGGTVNAIAGGGTLITFPALTAVGVPAVSANVTNTVALSPGYLGGTYAQRSDLAGQRGRLRLLVPVVVLGGLTGGVLLLATGEDLFRELVPFLILGASLLVLLQERIRARVLRRTAEGEPAGPHEAWVAVPAFAASVYGGYFGAGLGVILLAVLGLVLEDTLTRVNALKQALSFCVNVAAAAFFLFSGKVVWSAALVMAFAALVGGSIGGRLAGRMRAELLRRIVALIGFAVGIAYLVKGP